MVSVSLGRRAFVEALVAVPLGGVALSAQASSTPVKVLYGIVKVGPPLKL